MSVGGQLEPPGLIQHGVTSAASERSGRGPADSMPNLADNPHTSSAVPVRSTDPARPAAAVIQFNRGRRCRATSVKAGGGYERGEGRFSSNR
jgi:hypothetical protein